MNKKQAIEYFKKNELNIQNAHAAAFLLDLIYFSYITSYKVNGVDYSPIFSYSSYRKLGGFYQIIPQRIMDGLGKKIYSDYKKNPKSLITKINNHGKLDREIFKIWERYKKNPEEDLLKIYRDFVKISREWWRYGVIGEDKAEVINKEVAPAFAKRHNIDIERAKEIMSILSHPEERSALSTERIDFLKISLNPKNKKKINDYLKKYFWFKTDFYKAQNITKESLLKEASKEKNPLKELKQIENNFKNILKEKKNILSKLKLTKEDKKDLYFAQGVSSWMEQRKIGMMIQCYYILSFLEDISKKNNMKYSELVLYTVNELEDLLKTGDRVNKKEIDNRIKGTFYIFERDKRPKLIHGKDAEELFKKATFVKKAKEIKGQVASRGGVIKGIVKIVSNPAQDSFKKGEILVTSMTRTEFIPLMRKAKAIVTNEGGIACHAAIVSRELGIPCIIGTKIATKTLKNGDLVEVDTNKGIIRIIK